MEPWFNKKVHEHEHANNLLIDISFSEKNGIEMKLKWHSVALLDVSEKND